MNKLLILPAIILTVVGASTATSGEKPVPVNDSAMIRYPDGSCALANGLVQTCPMRYTGGMQLQTEQTITPESKMPASPPSMPTSTPSSVPASADSQAPTTPVTDNPAPDPVQTAPNPSTGPLPPGTTLTVTN